MHVKQVMVCQHTSDWSMLRMQYIRKSQVVPLRFISIPQLELTAATLSVKVSRLISEEIDVHINDEIFWTDSQTVLGYINSDVQHFKIFVANQVQLIRGSGILQKLPPILQMMLQEVWSQNIKRRSKGGSKVHHSHGEKNIFG